MVTTRMTVVEHAKQLVSHGAHAADIEVVEGLLAELEKSKKAFENLQQLTRSQLGLVRMSETLRNWQPPPVVIEDVVASVRKLQLAATEFEVFRNQWKTDNPDLVDPTEEEFKIQYLNNFSLPLDCPAQEGTLAIVGGRDSLGRTTIYTLPKLPTPMYPTRPPLDQYDDVVPAPARSQELNS